MTRKDIAYFTGIILIAALLIANLIRPTAPYAYEIPESRSLPPVMISGTGDSAWAVVGDKIYYLSLRARSELPTGQRTINVIDTRVLE